MQPMTGKERFTNVLALKPVDHSPCYEDLWPETYRLWQEKGLLKGDFVEQFKLDMRGGGWLNSTADLDFKPVILEESGDTQLILDGNGAKLRRHTKHSSTPEHVDFTVTDRTAWEEKIKPMLVKTDRRRFNLDGYKEARAQAARNQEFFCWTGVAPFEQMHPLCGHEHMLVGMALDPDWVKDMVMTYVEMTIRHLEILFAEGGLPDGAFVYEDMGFKERPFMSPEMYQEIVEPGHKRLFDFFHGKGLKVIVHSCGFVEPLVPGLIRAGMNCLQAMEVKAGMNMPRLAKQYGKQIAFFGGVDARAIISNDKAVLDAEMDRVITPLMEMGCSYVVHSDHSIPPEVEFETLQYFLERGRRMTARR
jgi:uroporphyrinogen decarboxylase